MTRQQLHELIDVVPEASITHVGESLEDVLAQDDNSEAIWSDPGFLAHVTERVLASEKAFAEGDVVSMDDAKRRFAKWLKR